MTGISVKLNHRELQTVLIYINAVVLNQNKATPSELLIRLVLSSFFHKTRNKYMYIFQDQKKINFPIEVCLCLLAVHRLDSYTSHELSLMIPIVTEIDKLVKQLQLNNE